MQAIRSALHAEDPTVILVQGMALAAHGIELHREEHSQPGWVGLVDSFIEVDIAETTTLLHLLAALTDDDLMRARIRHTLASRRQPVPSHVRLLPEARVTRAWVMEEELTDGDNVILGVAWPDGGQAALVVYVDRVMGTIVKDAFVVGLPPEALVGRFADLALDERELGIIPVPLALADARARIESAIARFDEFHPEWSQEMWPMCRPLLEYLLRTLPTGGTGCRVDTPSAAELDELTDAFLASPEAAGLPVDHDLRDAARHLLRYAAETFGDPLWWSITTVDRGLGQDLAFDPDISQGTADVIPDVVPPFIRWAHRTRGIEEATTSRTLAAVTALLPIYETYTSSEITSRLRETDRLMRAVREGDYSAVFRDVLVQDLGSVDAVKEMDAAPLPDEELDLTVVPPDLIERVVAIDGHLDRVIATLPAAAFGMEFRTACRRFLAGVADREPDVLRRRAKDLNTAAAIALAVARSNDLVGQGRRAMTAQALMGHFGVSSSPSSRAVALVEAFTGRRASARGTYLGSPDVLVSSRRMQLMEARDRWW